VSVYKYLDENFSGAFNRTIMRILMCSLAAILSLALSSTVLAEERTDRQKITGTVVSVTKDGNIVVVNDGSRNFEFLLFDDAQTPKVGEKVRVHYRYHNRGRYATDKIEKLGDAKGNSPKR
jgi:hypothetical protein